MKIYVWPDNTWEAEVAVSDMSCYLASSGKSDDYRVIKISNDLDYEAIDRFVTEFNKLCQSLHPVKGTGGDSVKAAEEYVSRPGHDDLWGYFGLDRPTWLTLPRVLMHEMSDEWQGKMAALMEEWEEHWDFSKLPIGTRVQITEEGKLVKTPSWLINYRYPDVTEIANMRRVNAED